MGQAHNAPLISSDPQTRPGRRRLSAWLVRYAIEPEYLPRPLRHIGAGYVLAPILPCVAGFLVIFLLQLVPHLQFSESLILLAVLAVSLCWGLLPGLIASMAGIGFFLIILLPPRYPFVIESRVDTFSTVMFAITSLSLSLLTSRIQRTRLQAQQAQREAEVANRIMDDFISMVVHELLTPLTAAHTSLQLLRRRMKRLESLPQGEKREAMEHSLQVYLDGTLSQLDFQNRLIQDLLDASRIRLKHLKLSVKSCNLGEIVHSCVEERRLLHPERSLFLNATPDQNIPIETDPDRVHQVLGNYISNALKYSAPDTSVIVSVTRAPSLACVSVTDWGPGLAVEQQQEIWNRFYRVPGIHVQSGSSVGLGLGLYISRNIIERLGGQVGVRSAPGQGSTFWFGLPLSPTTQSGENQRE